MLSQRPMRSIAATTLSLAFAPISPVELEFGPPRLVPSAKTSPHTRIGQVRGELDDPIYDENRQADADLSWPDPESKF